MRRIIILVLLFTLGKVNAQANLVLSSGSLQTTTISKGEHLSATLRIGNTGNVAAGKSHFKVYVSPNTTLASATLLSEISCESISSAQQTSNINFIFPLPYNVSTGINYLLVAVDSRNEITETNENNTFYITSTFSVNTTIGGEQNLPYPIILMHGLTGSDQTWSTFINETKNYFGYSYGGNFDFCLNQDGDDTYSYLYSDVKDWSDATQIGAGDFYTVNFNLNNLGTKYVASSKSNQSAAVKQGYAMSKVIAKVLALTGRDKVILVGHSMGGLACREYLQNTYRWQADGKHHVAKLFTNGTPHGGSNSTSFGLGAGGTDEKSEAVRDLRRTYAISGDAGVYLFGGVETYSSINNNILFNYHNVDVNCNGVEGNSIVGLNQKNIPTDLPYTCVIGNDPSTLLCSSCDGIVNETSANLNNYLNVNADTFVCIRSGSGISSPLHIELPQQTDYMFKGLDESNEYNTAYEIKSSIQYFGNISKQSTTGYALDYDDYKFNIPSSGKLNIKLSDIPLSDYTVSIFDSATNLVGDINSNGKGSLNINASLINPGKYFLEFSGTPEQNSWVFPYAFKIDFITSIPIIGNIITPKKSILKNAVVKLSKDSSTSVLSDANGSYSFVLDKIGNYIVKPSKNNDIKKNNGVSSIDVILVTNHILNKAKLNSPYKLIAADVNNNKTITNIDLIFMKRLILGTDTTFTGNRLWAFVDSAYNFPDTTNPFPYKDSISFSNLTSNKTNQTFIGVKLGDVNYDWNPALAKGITNKSVELVCDAANLRGFKNLGGLVEIPITVKNFKDLTALQYTLNFNNNNYEFVAIENNKLGIEFNATQANKTGNISFLWADAKGEEKNLEDGSVIFTLVLKAKDVRCTMCDVRFNLSNDITEIEAWDKDNQQHHIILTQKLTNQPINQSTNQQFTVSPNPAKAEINVIVKLNKNTNTNLIVYNALGQKILASKQFLFGDIIKEIKLDIQQLQTGAYYVQIQDDKNNILANTKFIKTK